MIWPLVFPAIVAGSIFTFSLTLGDFITPSLVSSTQFIGTVDLLEHHHQPAARRCLHDVPIAIMIVYLLIARRLGAFEHV